MTLSSITEALPWRVQLFLSFLSSLFFSEGVPYHLNTVAVDANDIEANPPVEAPVGLKIYLSTPYDVPFLPVVYGIEGGSECAAFSPLHLNEDKATVFFRNDIDLSERASEVRGNDPVPLPFQNHGRPVFPFLPRYPFIGHNTPLRL